MTAPTPPNPYKTEHHKVITVVIFVLIGLAALFVVSAMWASSPRQGVSIAIVGIAWGAFWSWILYCRKKDEKHYEQWSQTQGQNEELRKYLDPEKDSLILKGLGDEVPRPVPTSRRKRYTLTAAIAATFIALWVQPAEGEQGSPVPPAASSSSTPSTAKAASNPAPTSAKKAEEHSVSATENAQTSTPPPSEEPTPAQPQNVVGGAQATQPQSNAYYPNCSAAKAAGVAPIYRGSPGYSTKLDRDGDGIACEK